MPLSIGNKWIGQRTVYESGSAVTTPDTLEIVATENLRGETWYKAKTGERFINRSEGLEVTGDSFCGRVVSKYPARAGEDIFISSETILLSDNAEPFNLDIVNKTISIDSSITVPAGSYAAHLYRIEPRDTVARMIRPVSRFYVPDLGPVRIDVERMGVLVERWELLEAVLR